MKKDKLLNGSAGYGELTQLIRMKKVWMIEHQEGIGTEESPRRSIRTFFDEEGQYILRDDPFTTKEKE